MHIEFIDKNGSPLFLTLSKLEFNEKSWKYELVNETEERMGIISVSNGCDISLTEKSDMIADSDDTIQLKLEELLHTIIDAESSGVDNFSEAEEPELNPYNPDDIKVRNDKIPITLLAAMIENEDLNLNPDFQRHLVWDSGQKSRLIESILLRIPLPMFYFSEDKEGKLVVVDGLQRISTIFDFMQNKFPLQKLQYLQDSCGGKYYKSEGKKKGLDTKYYRWFNLTTISANIIDPSSPSKVKYDIFRRINTGGRSLNNQEIRNCLTGKTLRNALKEMTSSTIFKVATDGSIKSKRMDDQEIALRFLMFYKYYEESGKINVDDYNGYMETSLDDFTEEVSNVQEGGLDTYVSKFYTAMENAKYLIGPKYAFRKIRMADLAPLAYKQLINKALFVCTTVLLADYDTKVIRRNNKEGTLAKLIAEIIDKDPLLYSYITYGTNGRKNLTFTFNEMKKLFEKSIIYE